MRRYFVKKPFIILCSMQFETNFNRIYFILEFIEKKNENSIMLNAMTYIISFHHIIKLYSLYSVGPVEIFQNYEDINVKGFTKQSCDRYITMKFFSGEKTKTL